MNQNINPKQLEIYYLINFGIVHLFNNMHNLTFDKNLFLFNEVLINLFLENCACKDTSENVDHDFDILQRLAVTGKKE